MKDNERIVAQRTIYFDYLRVLATFAVMILHISAQNWGACDVQSFDWQVFNFFDSIVRWSVPIFVMISGALFLNRDIPLKKIYTSAKRRKVSHFSSFISTKMRHISKISSLLKLSLFFSKVFVAVTSGTKFCFLIFSYL